MRFVSLFAGIGGMDLGLERAGWTCVGQVEIDPYCRKVLHKHWPHVPKMEDVREFKGHEFGEFDFLVGGFPCQDISNAGKRAGITGERSGLYGQVVRCLRVVRPRGALLENVAALLARGMGTVLGDLAEIGYDAEWDCVPACSVGAPHMRNRVFIVAHAKSIRRKWRGCVGKVEGTEKSEGRVERTGWTLETQPIIARVVDGIPSRVDRLRGIGNAVVPQVAELIGRSILAAM